MSFDFMQVHSSNNENIERYDPDFILHFSIHSLLKGYIEPAEFAGLGLLAVALVSMSSSDDRIRRLGYETLGIFKQALEVMLSSDNCLLLSLFCVWSKFLVCNFLIVFWMA